MIDIFVSNDLIIKNPSDLIWQWVHENLIIANPDYYKKQRLGKWVGNTSKEIFLYRRKGDVLHIPFGCLQKLHQIFGVNCVYHVNFGAKNDIKYQSNINTYDYQEEAVNAVLKKKNGVLVMPCGSGKTQTALEIVSRLGGSVLWLTHTKDLLKQSMDRAKAVLSTDSTYGMITEGKIDIGTGITFATVQTMSKINLADYKNFWNIIIVDECQHCCGSPTRVTQFYKVVNSLSARYKIGLTATPKRADGLEQSMFALLGDIIHTVTKGQVANTTCPIKIKFVETFYEPDYNCILMGDGTIDYVKLVDDMINNNDRFSRILDEIENNANHSVLVLANRVAYIQRLHEAFSGKSVCLSTLGQSKKAKAERKEVLQKLNDGELDAVFATYQLAKEGLDVPNLRYVVFATPEKNDITVIQSAGRVGRKAEGKEFGTVIDFVDDFGMYFGWAQKRKGFYKRINAEVIDIDVH